MLSRRVIKLRLQHSKPLARLPRRHKVYIEQCEGLRTERAKWGELELDTLGGGIYQQAFFGGGLCYGEVYGEKGAIN